MDFSLWNYNTQQCDGNDTHAHLSRWAILAGQNITSVRRSQSFLHTQHLCPANSGSKRNTMFNQIAQLLNNLDNGDEIKENLVIAGDFNFSFDNSIRGRSPNRPHKFLELITSQFHDCINYSESDQRYRPTFSRKRANQQQRSCIGYIFAGNNLSPKLNNGDVKFLNSTWTDHALLTITYTTGLTSTGKGIWKANPNLATILSYRRNLQKKVQEYLLSKFAPTWNFSHYTAQDKWDDIKRMTKKFTQTFCRNRISIREQQLQKLQHERNDCIAKDQDCYTLTNSQVPIIEDKISELENEVTEVIILKAGKRWMENNEKSAGYLKRTAATRLQKRNIGTLKHPNSSILCITTEEKKEAVREFYSILFSVEDISEECIEAMLEKIDKHFTEEETAELLIDIEYADILKGSARSPNKSSPWLDGLPYEIIHLLIQISCCRDIVHTVFNEALQKGVFPKSWQEACIILLPKSGDLSDIGNWRPITLINADCKIFTRILNARLMEIAPKIIGEHQIGFMQDRFIGDHGVALKIIFEDASKSDSENIGIGDMLDQTKAYDRIHPEYLCRVMTKFGIPEIFVNCIKNLFFDNRIFINMNGFLSEAIDQKRGLRQGDSISPILFNMAIEPFLLSIVNNNNIQGYCSQSRQANPSLTHVPNRPVKASAYADDVLIIIKSEEEFRELQASLHTYNAASNSRVNYQKSIAFPLTGRPSQDLRLQTYIRTSQGLRWFDKNSTECIKYLGYPIWFTAEQRNLYCTQLQVKITHITNIHLQRDLSMYGRSTIANTLILSKMWHCLRITTFPKTILKKIDSTIYQFVTHQKFPKPNRKNLRLPKCYVGLGLMNCITQQTTLQFRYIKAILYANKKNPIAKHTYNLLSDHIQLRSNTVDSRLPFIVFEMRPPAILSSPSYLYTIFKAFDHCPQPKLEAVKWNTTLAMTLPMSAIFKPQDHIPIPNNKTVQHFYSSHPNNLLDFMPRTECRHRILWVRIRGAVLNGLLHYKPFFQSLIRPNLDQAIQPHIPLPANTELSTIMSSISFYSTMLQDMSNRELREMVNYHNSITPATSTIPSAAGYYDWEDFIKTSMHSTPRNIWYRLCLGKLAHKQNTFNKIPTVDSDRCTACNDVEDSKHMLFTCPSKSDIWKQALSIYFPFIQVTPSQAHQDLMDLQMWRYTTPVRRPKLRPINILSTILWKISSAHWRLHFDGTPIVTDFVFKDIDTALCKIKSLI